ncbi:hypothetical protein GGH13_006418, partial [Coemansia sp. S155-1]
ARCACTRLGQQKSKASGYITVLPTPVCLCFASRKIALFCSTPCQNASGDMRTRPGVHLFSPLLLLLLASAISRGS